MLVSHYPKSLIPSKPTSIHQGLVFIASEDKYVDPAYRESQNQIMAQIQSLSWMGLDELLMLFYWSTYSIEIIQNKYEQGNSDLLQKIRKLKEDPKISFYDIYDNVLEAYNDFNNYRLSEVANLRVAKENSDRYNLKRLAKYSQPITRIKLNVFEDLWAGSNRFIESESKKLNEIQADFDSLFQYYSNWVNNRLNKTNLSLQKSMNRMTIVMLFLTIATIALTLSPYYSQIGEFFKNLNQLSIPPLIYRLIHLANI